MARNTLTTKLTPSLQAAMKEMGDRIKLARLRRNLTQKVICSRAMISNSTLVEVEQGSSRVAFGIYLRVLHALGLSGDIAHIAGDDKLGKELQDNILLNGRVKK